MKLKIAMCQLLIEGGEPERNLERAEELIEIAKDNDSDIALLPECIDFGWTHPSGIKNSDTIPGKYSDQLCEMAKKYKIYICVGLTEKDKSNNKNYNSAILIDENGKIILKHRKINILKEAFDYYEVGNKLEVKQTKFGKIGLNICSDNYMDAIDIGIVLGRMGSDFILSPSSWTVDYEISENNDPYHDKWEKPLSFISKKFNIAVISTTSVGYIVGGPFEGKKMIGCSIAIDKDGKISKGEFNEFANDIKFFETTLNKKKIKGTEVGQIIYKKNFFND
jgi:predicted amidohydrolase